MVITARRAAIEQLLLLAAAIFVLLPSLASAQSTGRIRGVVSDAQ